MSADANDMRMEPSGIPGTRSLQSEDGAFIAVSTETAATAPRPLSMRRNFVWTVTGNVVYAGCQWGMLMALAKLGSPEMVGQFALGLAIGAPVILLGNLQLRAIQATDVLNRHRFGEYLALRLMTTTLAFVVICLIAWLAGYRSQTAIVVILVGLAKAVESISDVVYGLMQKYERLDRIAIAMILRGVGSVALMTLVLWLTHSVAWAVVALATWWTLVLGLYERWAALWVLGKQGVPTEDLRPLWHAAQMKSLAWLSLPLGATALLVSLNTNVPRYFVEHHLGEAALGYFAALGYVMIAGTTIMSALGQSAIPRLARYFATDRAAFKRLLVKMLTIAALTGVSGMLVAYLLGREVLSLVYRPDYADYHNVFVWLMAAAAVSYLVAMLSYAMTAARELRPQAWFQAVSLGISALACVWLIPAFGMYGAAWALLLGGTVKFVLSGVYTFRLDRRDVPHWRRS